MSSESRTCSPGARREKTAMFAACPLENANPWMPPSRIAIVRSSSCLVGFESLLYANPVDAKSSGWRNVAVWKIGILTAPVTGSVPSAPCTALDSKCRFSFLSKSV